MPISGAVVTIRPDDADAASRLLSACPGVEVHGADDRGNIVVVLDTTTVEQMEELIRTLSSNPLILHLGLTYLNMEDVLPPDGGEVD